MRPYEGYAPADGTEMGAGVRGLFHLLQAALARGIERIVFQSTINITAPSWDHWRLIEAESPRPGSHGYTLGKTLAEELCQAFTRQHPITIAVIRFGGVFTLEEEGFENAAPDLHPIPSSCVERRDIAQALPPSPEQAATQPLRSLPHLPRPARRTFPHQQGPRHFRLPTPIQRRAALAARRRI